MTETVDIDGNEIEIASVLELGWAERYIAITLLHGMSEHSMKGNVEKIEENMAELVSMAAGDYLSKDTYMELDPDAKAEIVNAMLGDAIRGEYHKYDSSE